MIKISVSNLFRFPSHILHTVAHISPLLPAQQTESKSASRAALSFIYQEQIRRANICALFVAFVEFIGDYRRLSVRSGLKWAIRAR